MDEEQPAIIYVVYLPYLPLAERVVVGGWELIPREVVAETDCQDARARELALALAAFYTLPDQARSVGALARPPDALIGHEPHQPEDLRDLHRTFVIAVLDGNQSRLGPKDERDPNAGHYAMTSDNAVVVAHGINREHGFTGSVSGSRVPRLSLGITLLEPFYPGAPPNQIAPPVDLRIPLKHPRLDVEYANATWDSIRRREDAARRLGRAIDWLNLVWLNATGLTNDLRIPALRAGFEVLLDSDKTDVLAPELARLLGDDSEKAERAWLSRNGNSQSERMTDVAWWFTRFSHLRNALMHGRAPTRDDWIHDGEDHTDLGEGYLRLAIKHIVANDGHEHVLEDLIWRNAVRQARETWQQFKQEPPSHA